MKIWQKLICVVSVLVMAVPVILLLAKEKPTCPLCSSQRYHAPCLIDLETGELLELALYVPHGTRSGELAAEQPKTDTFSLLRLGDATGFRQTGSRLIQMEIPCADTASTSALCKDCQKLTAGYGGRYILADLYRTESPTWLPVTPGTETALRCYQVTMTLEETKNSIRVTVQGTRNETHPRPPHL